MPRASVNALSHGKRGISVSTACLDIALPRTYTLPFALDGLNLGYPDYRKGNH